MGEIMNEDKFPMVCQAVIAFTVITDEKFYDGILYKRRMVVVEVGHDKSVFIKNIEQYGLEREIETESDHFKNLEEYARRGKKEAAITEKIKEFMKIIGIPHEWGRPLNLKLKTEE